MASKRPRLRTFKVGTFLRIPLEDGSFGYGRELREPYSAYYDYRTLEPSADLDIIEAQPVLFTTSVRVRTCDPWEVLGVRPLTGEVTKPVVRFMQDIGNYLDCRIFDTAGMSRQAKPEECIGLERAAVWDGHGIEERLLDHFMGRPNAEELRMRVRLK